LKEAAASVTLKEGEGAPQDDGDFNSPHHVICQMSPRHKAATDSWDKWHMLNCFLDGHGGIQGREDKHKVKGAAVDADWFQSFWNHTGGKNNVSLRSYTI